jgi:hypothetical protein
MVPSFTYINPCYGVRPALNLKWGSMVTTYKNGRRTLISKSDIPSPTITTSEFAGGKVGEVYSQTLKATSEYNLPVTWSIQSGSLPDGLTLNAGTGEISGTPAVAGTFTFTIKADNGGPVPITKQFSVTIASNSGEELKQTVNPPVDGNTMNQTTPPPTDGNTVIQMTQTAEPPVTAIRTPLKTLYLKKGTSFTPLVYTDSVNPTTKKAGATANLTWTSSKPKIATVDKATGTIRAKEAGAVKITATASNGKKLTITVNVVKNAVKLKDVAFTKPPASLKTGKTAILKLKVTPAKATNLNVKFSSSNKKVLTVDKAGKLTALKKGKAKITVKIGKKTYVKTITVK